MPTIAQRERTELTELALRSGPEAPTLCGEWTVRDLLAHLVLRERRLDAAPGILLSPLAGYTQKVQDGLAARDFDELVDDVRGGPPFWSPFRLLDSQVNAMELFVHHEDVRRAAPGWQPRLLPATQQQDLWGKLKAVGRLGYRRSPVGVVLQRTSGAQMTAKKGPRTVTLIGEPAELLLHAMGRDEVRIDTRGDQADVDTVLHLERSF
ncbi:MAG: TIGR03085 family metal-binding protein [Mycobacteriaceae bacterium]